MTNPKYQGNIYYVPTYLSGKRGTYATQSDGSSLLVSTTDTYNGGYFQANMPELKIYATGSSHIGALTTLMSIATASTTFDNGLQPL